MDILTDGRTFSHARPANDRGDLEFVLSSEAPHSEGHTWWGTFRKNDRLWTAPDGPRAELLDVFFRRLSPSLAGTELRITRTGVHHLRVHGSGPVRLRVRRRRTLPARWRTLRRAAAAAATLLALLPMLGKG